jgi:hypothetical protein
MIHFIGKVFLEYAEAKPLLNKISVDPSKYIRIVDKGLSHIIDAHTHELNILNFKNVEDCIQQFGSIDSFVDYAIRHSEDDKLLIYCDEVSLPTLMIAMWKSIFPNITPALIKNFMSSFKDYELLKRNDFNEYIDIGRHSARIGKEDFINGYWNMSVEDISKVLTASPTIDLKDKQDAVGLEYFFIKSLLSEKDEVAYKRRFDYLYKKNFLKEVLFMISNIKEYAIILLKAKQQIETIELNDNSILDYFKNNPKYKIMFDNQLRFSAQTYDHIKSNYNLIELLTTLYKDSLTIHKETNPAFVSSEEFKIENPITSFIVQNHREPAILEMLSEDILQISNYHFLRNFVSMGTFNHYLLQSVLLTHKSDPEKLNELN